MVIIHRQSPILIVWQGSEHTSVSRSAKYSDLRGYVLYLAYWDT